MCHNTHVHTLYTAVCNTHTSKQKPIGSQIDIVKGKVVWAVTGTYYSGIILEWSQPPLTIIMLAKCIKAFKQVWEAVMADPIRGSQTPSWRK